MIVAGGTYREQCVAPRAELLFGSGGRAALALQQVEQVVLHTFHPSEQEVLVNFGPCVVHTSSSEITFQYLHPLARPRITPIPLPYSGTVEVHGDSVIRFGCLEGSFRVRASVAIYDPQSGGRPEPFHENGSSADRLALVLNSREARYLAREDDVRLAGPSIRKDTGAEVVVVKCGTVGALVFDENGMETVPAYRTTRLFKIGSGDVFTAMFAHHWGTAGLPPVEAARLASRHVAAYVSNRTLPCHSMPPEFEPVTGDLGGRHVCIAVDDDDLANSWLVHEAREVLLDLGAGDVATTDTKHHLGSAVFAIPRHSMGRAMSIVVEANAAGVDCVIFSSNAAVTATARRAGITVVDDFAASLYAMAWGRS